MREPVPGGARTPVPADQGDFGTGNFGGGTIVPTSNQSAPGARGASSNYAPGYLPQNVRPEEDFSERGLEQQRRDFYAATLGRANQMRTWAEQGLPWQPGDPGQKPNDRNATWGVTQQWLDQAREKEIARLEAEWNNGIGGVDPNDTSLIGTLLADAQAVGVDLTGEEISMLTNMGMLDRAANVYTQRMEAGDTQGAANVILTMQSTNPIMASLVPIWAEEKFAEGVKLAQEAAQDGSIVTDALTAAGDWALNSWSSPLYWANKEWELGQHALRAMMFNPASQDPNRSTIEQIGSGLLNTVALVTGGRGKALWDQWQATSTGSFNTTKLQALEAEYSPEVVAAAVKLSQGMANADPSAMTGFLEDPNVSPEVLAFVRDILWGGAPSSDFDAQELMRKVDEANLGSTGQIWVNNVLGDIGSGSTLRETYSDVVSIGAGFVDPLMFVGTPIRAVTAARYAILKLAPEVGRAGIATALASKTVAGVETNRARRFFQSFLREADRLDQYEIGSQAYASQRNRIARQFRALPDDVAEFLIRSTRVKGVPRAMESVVDEQGNIVTQGLVDVLADANEAWLVSAGRVSKKAAEAGLDLMVNRALAAKIIETADPLEFAAARAEGLITKEILDEGQSLTKAVIAREGTQPISARMASRMQNREMMMPRTGLLADLRIRAVNRVIANAMPSRRAREIVDKYLAEADTPAKVATALNENYESIGKASRLVVSPSAPPGRAGAAFDNVTRMWSSMPNNLLLDIARGSNADDFYKFARMFFNRKTAEMLVDAFRRGDPGVRRDLIIGVVRSGAASRGVNLTKAEVKGWFDNMGTGTRPGEMYAIGTPEMPSAWAAQSNLADAQVVAKEITKIEKSLAKVNKELESLRSTLALEGGTDAGLAGRQIAKLEAKQARLTSKLTQAQANMERHRNAVMRFIGGMSKPSPSTLPDHFPPPGQAPVIPMPTETRMGVAPEQGVLDEAAAATAAQADTGVSPTAYIARRDMEDLRQAMPDLDTRTGMFDEINGQQVPRDYENTALAVGEWRKQRLLEKYPGVEPGSGEWWDNYFAEFYPEINDDTVITIYRGLTKRLADDADPLSVPGEARNGSGAFWTLNPQEAQAFSRIGDAPGRMAEMRLTLRELIDSAGSGNAGVVNNNRAFGPGAVGGAFPDEYAVVLDYTKLPESAKATARFIDPADIRRSIDTLSRADGFTPVEQLLARGGKVRSFARDYGMDDAARLVDDAELEVGAATRRLANARKEGYAADRIADAEKALADAEANLAVVRRETADGTSMALLFEPIEFDVAVINANKAQVSAILKKHGVTMDQVRTVLPKTGDKAKVSIEAYRRAEPELRAAVDEIADASGVTLMRPRGEAAAGAASDPAVVAQVDEALDRIPTFDQILDTDAELTELQSRFVSALDANDIPRQQSLTAAIEDRIEKLQSVWAQTVLADEDTKALLFKWLHPDKIPDELVTTYGAEYDATMLGRQAQSLGLDASEVTHPFPEFNPKTGKRNNSFDAIKWYNDGEISPRTLVDLHNEYGDEGLWRWWNTGTVDVSDAEYARGALGTDIINTYGPAPSWDFVPKGKNLIDTIPGEYRQAATGKGGKRSRTWLSVPWHDGYKARNRYITDRFNEEMTRTYESVLQGAEQGTLDRFIGELEAQRARLTAQAVPEPAAVESAVPNASPAPRPVGVEPLPLNQLNDLDSSVPDFIQRNGTINDYGVVEEIDGVVYTIAIGPRQNITISSWKRRAKDEWNTDFIRGERGSPMPDAAVTWDLQTESWKPGGTRLRADKPATQKQIDNLMAYAEQAEARYNLSPWLVDDYAKLPDRIQVGGPARPAPPAGAAPEPAPSGSGAQPPNSPPVDLPAFGDEPIPEGMSLEDLEQALAQAGQRRQDPVMLADSSVAWSPSRDQFGHEHAMHLYQTADWVAIPHLGQIEAIGRIRSSPLGRFSSEWLARKPTDFWSLATLYGWRFSQRSAIEDLVSFMLTGGMGHLGDLYRGRRASTAYREATPSVIVRQKEVAGVATNEDEIVLKSRLGMVASRSRRASDWLTEKLHLSNRASVQEFWLGKMDRNKLLRAEVERRNGNYGPIREVVVEAMVRQHYTGLSPADIDNIADLVASPTGRRILEGFAEDASNINRGRYASLSSALNDLEDIPDIEMAKPGVPVVFGDYKKVGLSADNERDPYAIWWWHRGLQAIVDDDGPIGRIAVALLHDPARAKAAIADAIRKDTRWGYKERFTLITDDASIDDFANRYFESVMPYFQKKNGQINENLRRRFIVTFTDKSGKQKFKVRWRTTDEAGRNRLLVTTQDLAGYGSNARPQYVLGREANIPMPRNEKALWSDRAWDWMGAQYARISREPIFLGNYIANRRVLKPWEDSLARAIAGGKKPTKAQQMMARQVADRQAQDAAYSFSLAYMDNPNNRSVLAWKLRNVSRYYRATEDFYRRAQRLAKNYPDAYYKLALTYQIMDDSGFTYRDENGDVYFAYPMNGFLQDALATVFSFLPGGTALSVGTMVDPFMMGGRLKGIAPSTDPYQWLPSLAGPLGVAPMVGVMNLFPALQGIKSLTLGEYSNAGQTGDLMGEMWKALMPAGIQRMWKVMSPEEQDAAMGSTVASTIAVMVANGDIEIDPNNPMTLEQLKNKDIYAEAQKISFALQATKLVMGWTVPASPQVYQNTVTQYAREMGISGMNGYFHTLLDKYDGDYAQAFAAWAKIDPDGRFLPFTVSKTEENPELLASLAGAKPYVEVLEWTRQPENQALAKEFPDAYLFLAPQRGEFSWAGWAMVKALGLRVEKDENDMIIDMLAAKGERLDAQIRADYAEQMAVHDPSTPEGRKAIADLEDRMAYDRSWVEMGNPYWAAKRNEIRAPYQANRLRDVFTQTNQMLYAMREEQGDLTGTALAIENANSLWLQINGAKAGINPNTTEGKEQRRALDGELSLALGTIAESDPAAANYIDTILLNLDYGSIT